MKAALLSAWHPTREFQSLWGLSRDRGLGLFVCGKPGRHPMPDAIFHTAITRASG